ncbi:MAG: hypothetical protein HOC23_16045 [Halieaceae bacterium]|nr:hypothetical protein [Halieaceae bacterium]
MEKSSEGNLPQEFHEKSTVAANRFALNSFMLRFRDDSVESAYREHITEGTLWYCRIAWFLTFLLVCLFGLLDQQLYKDAVGPVQLARTLLITVAVGCLAATYIPRFQPYIDWTSSVCVLSIGTFSTLLTAMSDPTTFSPYFTSLVFAHTGMFLTLGLGFRHCSLAVLINLAIFEVVIGVISPVEYWLFLVYNFFLCSMVLIFLYLCFLTELVSRNNYIASLRLQSSLDDIRTLKGMLPICSHCKMVRDDSGYWNQIEQYIVEHSEATLTHGICPDCIKEHYPEMNLSSK